MENKKFTEDDIDACWPHHKAYLVGILNGEYAVEAAREDLGSLVDARQCEVRP